MKKIIIVSCVFPPEPLVSARLSADIAQDLSSTENVIVLCPRPSRPIGSNLYRPDIELPYQCLTLPSYTCPKSNIWGRLKESYSFGHQVSKYIETNHNDIKCIYANTHPTFGQYLLLNTAQKYNIPCIIHIQDVYPESLTVKLGVIGKLLNPFLIKYDAHMMKKAKKLIAISMGMRTKLINSRKFCSENIDVVYNWQDNSIFSVSKSSANDKLTFMFVGSLSPSADLGTVIHAFGNADLQNAKLVIAGSGTQKEKCMNIASLYKDTDILFMPVSPNEVPEVQNNADILLLTLKKGISGTAMPSKLPAYLFSAKPIIASCEENSDIAHAITDAKCGWIVEPESIESLSKQFIYCSELDRQFLSKIGINGRRYGLNNYSKSVNLKKISKIIKDTANGGTSDF